MTIKVAAFTVSEKSINITLCAPIIIKDTLMMQVTNTDRAYK